MTIVDLTAGYGATTVLDAVTLTVPTGTVCCLTGENGSGKSTLLRCVTGLVMPIAGRVHVFGGPPDRSARFWRRVAATVENPSWYAGLTIREHVDLVRLSHGVDPYDGVVDDLFEELGLTGLADRTPVMLSSGQRQRFLLCAVLGRPSDLLVLDEPEQRLDAEARTVVARHLVRYAAAGGTVLMASHDPTFVAATGAQVRQLDPTPVAVPVDPA